jgi:hypothetical protein
MSETSAAANPNATVWQPFDNRHRILLAVVSAGCVLLTMAVARLLGWPVFLRHEASLLASAAPLAGVAAVIVALAGSLIIASLLLGRLRYDAGFFAGCIGLAALSARGGPVSDSLRAIGNPRLYLTLLLETITLLGILGLAWQLLDILRRFGFVAPEPPDAEDAEEVPSSFAQHLLAAMVQATVTGLLIMLFAQSDAKKQVMAAVAVSSLLGALAAHQSIPVRPSAALWAGPFIAAIVGYAWALKSPGAWATGRPANGLAAASPLDYASLGTAGAIFGYWISRQWRIPPPEMEIPEEAIE